MEMPLIWIHGIAFYIDAVDRQFILQSDSGHVCAFELLEKRPYCFFGQFDPETKSFVEGSESGPGISEHNFNTTIPAYLLSELYMEEPGFAAVMNRASKRKNWNVLIRTEFSVSGCVEQLI